MPVYFLQLGQYTSVPQRLLLRSRSRLRSSGPTGLCWRTAVSAPGAPRPPLMAIDLSKAPQVPMPAASRRTMHLKCRWL